MKKEDKYHILKVFGLRSLLAFIIWMFLYHGIIIPDGRINLFLTNTVIYGTLFGLKALGYQCIQQGQTVLIDGEPVVLVADACNGLELFVLYAGFIICFPGRIKFKLLFIPFGILLIYIINVFREIILALNYKFFRESFEFNHKYTYVLIVYVFVFILWRIWIKRYSVIGEIITNE
jgi:exosortase/archaeosortase family protein